MNSVKILHAVRSAITATDDLLVIIIMIHRFTIGLHDSISATIRDVLDWLPIRQRVDFKLSVLVFNNV